jgi:hypothetical protein
MPRNTTIESTLRSRVDAFVDDLYELIREAALESVRETLQDALAGGAANAGPRRKAGRPKAAKRKRRNKGVRKANAAAPKAKKSGKRIRRSPEDLEKTANRILAYVTSHPGQGVEKISKALNKPSKDLKRPIQILVGEKKLRTEGQKRGTTYFAGGKRATTKRPAARKTTKKKTGRRATRKKAA